MATNLQLRRSDLNHFSIRSSSIFRFWRTASGVNEVAQKRKQLEEEKKDDDCGKDEEVADVCCLLARISESTGLKEIVRG